MNNTYFGFFDADSRPDNMFINYILTDEDTPPIYQMLSIYDSNFRNISSINQANSIFQSRWSFYFEFPRLFRNFYKTKSKNFMYLIGHGLFLRWDILDQFPLPEYSVAEDIAYWYRMTLNNIFAKPIPYFDHCSVPRSIFHNIFQTARRFEWEIFFYKEIFKKKLTLKNLWWMLLRYIQLAQRAFAPLLIIWSVMFSLMNGIYIIWITLIICIVLDIYSHLPIYNKFYKGITHKKIYTIFWPLLIKSLIDWVGPIFWIGKFIYQRILGVRSTFYRTPR